MDTHFVAQLLAYFKATFGLEINSAEELFETQRNLLEYLVCLGRELENEVFEQLGKGYEGATIEKDSKKYKFVGYRDNTIHGLFGEICYQRACYVSREEQGESWIPLDERLGIQKRHTPGVQLFSLLLHGAGGVSGESESVSRDRISRCEDRGDIRSPLGPCAIGSLLYGQFLRRRD